MTALIIVVSAVLLAFFCGTTSAANRANICTGHKHNDLVRNTLDCNAFYHCFNGLPIPNKCQNSQHFNALTSQCEPADQVECFSCPSDAVFVDVPVPNECQQFVRCFNRVPEQMTCADGLYFDRQLQQCNHRANVTCPFEVLCPRANDKPIFMRDRDNCAKFYVCLAGEPVAKMCPESLYFNAATEQCDHPQDSHCEAANDWLNDDPIAEAFACPTEGGPLFAHPFECQQFYTCSPSGFALRHTCPNGTYFDHKYWFCGQRSDVNCVVPTESTGMAAIAGSPMLQLN